MIQRLSLLVLGLVLLAPAARGDFEQAARLFASHYVHQYQPRQCGTNALNFVCALRQRTGDVSDYALVFIKNRGFTTFGMVNAELARTTRFGRPAAGEANWYHHVFVLDRAGRVFDFDFTAQPRVSSVRLYLKKMFLEETECQKKISGEFCVGRDKKLQDYEFSAVNAEEMLRNPSLKPGAGYTMEAVLRDHRVLFR